MHVLNILRFSINSKYFVFISGAYPILEYPDVLIDISSIAELKGCKFDQNAVIGAGTTLSELLDIFKDIAQKEYFGYLKELYDHLLLVAHIPVRNVSLFYKIEVLPNFA